MAIESLEDAIVILDCGEYLVATLNISCHVKKAGSCKDIQRQRKDIKRKLRLRILELER